MSDERPVCCCPPDSLSLACKVGKHAQVAALLDGATACEVGVLMAPDGHTLLIRLFDDPKMPAPVLVASDLTKPGASPAEVIAQVAPVLMDVKEATK